MGLVSLLLIPHLVVVEVMVPEGVDDAVDLLSLARQAEGLEEQADGGVELDVAEVKRLSVRVKSLWGGKCGEWGEEGSMRTGVNITARSVNSLPRPGPNSSPPRFPPPPPLLLVV